MKKFYKSTTNKQLSGVLGGASEIFNIDASILRIAYFALSIFTSGIFVLIYIAAAIILPTDQEVQKNQ
ncbi:PspC domain-containing protein [Bacillus sp. RAR_GA_16]|uniref:PspC domain-containing protein n=1 Tax=Bacillus sp. RAR_GA_16 TaxID=2876774 RepID=UPI001CCAA41E|nr:PspC domain-containing protein [Bacillus sp. RAR_GA_16]MCA0173870.1 PspC domain-containing protein [Bacillus sp. RAR_GA_16]